MAGNMVKTNELGKSAKFPDYAKPAGGGSGVHVVARGESARCTSGQTVEYTGSDYHYVARREIDVRRNSRGGVEVMGWFRSLWQSKIDERTLIREEMIAAEVSEINEIVSDFERLVKKNGSSRRPDRNK